MKVWMLLMFIALLLQGGKSFAQVSLFQSSQSTNRPALISLRPHADVLQEPVTGGAGSLFIGQSGRSLLAPFPERKRDVPQLTSRQATSLGRAISRGTPQLVMLRQLIADAEAGPLDYDAVQYGARIRPGKPPTQMTLAEIYEWIDRTPGQPHAIGRYQFIPPTLRSLVSQLGLPLETRFSPGVQDQLSDILLSDAGMADFTNGQISRHQFMNNLAKIWAGFPNSTGLSHYHGYAGNKASISWGRFDREMIRIFGS